MKSILAVLLLLVFCSISHSEPPRSPVKHMYIDEGKNSFITFEGRWIASYKRKNPLIPEINTVSTFCDTKTMICTETMAFFFSDNDEVLNAIYGLLIPKTNKYKVIEWSKSVVIAREEARVADIEIRISIPDKSVERSYRETKSRGVETSNPNNFQTWVLQ